MLVQDVSNDFALQSHHFIFIYSWTSLQRPPWGQEKVAIVERWPLLRGWNKSECMDCPSKKNSRCRNEACKWTLFQFHGPFKAFR